MQEVIAARQWTRLNGSFKSSIIIRLPKSRKVKNNKRSNVKDDDSPQFPISICGGRNVKRTRFYRFKSASKQSGKNTSREEKTNANPLRTRYLLDTYIQPPSTRLNVIKTSQDAIKTLNASIAFAVPTSSNTRSSGLTVF